MFRHVSKGRTYKHNVKLAGLLSFIAGMVNISGVLSVGTLTTNVTGHFAFFAERIEREEYHLALSFLLYIIAFFLGSFLSSLTIELSWSRKYRAAHVGPMLCEISILAVLGIYGDNLLRSGISGTTIAMLLLFAMGLQNALVSRVSKSVVRTTHLTGLFTDMGIELAQFLFYLKSEKRKQLVRSLNLKFIIISFFFVGCVAGGYLYHLLTLKVLAVAATLLVLALIYDVLKLSYYRLTRRALREESAKKSL